MIRGNTSETGDAGESPGKSSLFFLTASLDRGIGLPGDTVKWRAEPCLFCTVRCALDGP